MPTITYGGHTVPIVPISRLTLGEVDAVERAVGMTFKRISRLEQTCVCGHNVKSHTSRTDDGGSEVDACQECSCDTFVPDLPNTVATASLWVSVRRAIPTLSFATFNETEMEDLDVQDDEPSESPDPSQPASESGPETPTQDPTPAA